MSGKNPNIQETTLHLSVFFDTTKTDPDKLAKLLDELLHGKLVDLDGWVETQVGPIHVNHLHCPAVEVEAPPNLSPRGGQATHTAYNAGTIDEALLALTQAKEASHIGGDACVYVSLTDSGIEPLPVDTMALINDASGGAVFEVRAKLPNGFPYNPLGMDSSELEDQAEQIRKFSPPEDEDGG